METFQDGVAFYMYIYKHIIFSSPFYYFFRLFRFLFFFFHFLIQNEADVFEQKYDWWARL